MPSIPGTDATGRVAAVLSGACLVAACAREEPPPGALPDTRPPQVVEVVPGRDTVVPGFDDEVRVRFDEPVNLPGDLERQLVASPAYRWTVETGFSDVKIRPEGGWRADVVYCFELPEGISDLLRNRTEAPFGFCFSTGPPMTETEVEGRVGDRITGAAVAGARVLFLALPGDTTPYTAVTEREGTFRLRALPPREYWGYAFQDRNRNLRLDRALEPHDSASLVVEGPSGSASLEFRLTEPDSTPPVMAAAGSADPLTVRLQFDDHLDPEADEGRVTVRDTVRDRDWPIAWVRIGEPASFPPPDTAEVAPDTAEAAPDTAEAAPDTAGAAPDAAGAAPDAAGAAPDTAGAAPDTAGAAPDTAGAPPDTASRPAQVVTVRLERPLEAGVYRVVAEGFVNLRGLAGGGDTTFVYPPPEQGAGAAGGTRDARDRDGTLPRGRPRRRPR